MVKRIRQSFFLCPNNPQCLSFMLNLLIEKKNSGSTIRICGEFIHRVTNDPITIMGFFLAEIYHERHYI